MTLPRKKKTFQIDTVADKIIFFKNDFPILVGSGFGLGLE
jgi:hypothetical protein